MINMFSSFFVACLEFNSCLGVDSYSIVNLGYHYHLINVVDQSNFQHKSGCLVMVGNDGKATTLNFIMWTIYVLQLLWSSQKLKHHDQIKNTLIIS